MSSAGYTCAMVIELVWLRACEDGKCVICTSLSPCPWSIKCDLRFHEVGVAAHWVGRDSTEIPVGGMGCYRRGVSRRLKFQRALWAIVRSGTTG